MATLMLYVQRHIESEIVFKHSNAPDRCVSTVSMQCIVKGSIQNPVEAGKTFTQVEESQPIRTKAEAIEQARKYHRLGLKG